MKVLKKGVKQMKKPYIHVCEYCDYFDEDNGLCVNCSGPSDCRRVNRFTICDGGGIGADGYGFKPTQREDFKK